LIKSPEAASEMACPMLLQADVAEVQLLLLLPLTRFTYHVVVATAVEARAGNSDANKKMAISLCFMIFLFSDAPASSPGAEIRRDETRMQRDEINPGTDCLY